MSTADRFAGSDYEPMRDDVRLTGQLLDVWKVVKDGKPRSLDEIAKAAGGHPQSSVSAQLRHLRKPRFGGHQVDKLYLGNGLYHYTVTPNNEALVR